MDLLVCFLFVLVLAPNCNGQWPNRDVRRSVHHHTKRHMIIGGEGQGSAEGKRQTKQTTLAKANTLSQRTKVNYKPAGHLTPLKEDDIDNDEGMSVAIGPPPIRPTYDKLGWKPKSRNTSNTRNSPAAIVPTPPPGAVTLVKEVLSEIAKEFMSHQVSEDFVFGQYVGLAMRNISSEYKLKLQHEILDLVIKYQKMTQGEAVFSKSNQKSDIVIRDTKSKGSSNDTEDSWTDFTNLAKIVG